MVTALSDAVFGEGAILIYTCQGTNRTIKVWNARPGKVLMTIPSPYSAVSEAEFTREADPHDAPGTDVPFVFINQTMADAMYKEAEEWNRFVATNEKVMTLDEEKAHRAEQFLQIYGDGSLPTLITIHAYYQIQQNESEAAVVTPETLNIVMQQYRQQGLILIGVKTNGAPYITSGGLDEARSTALAYIVNEHLTRVFKSNPLFKTLFGYRNHGIPGVLPPTIDDDGRLLDIERGITSREAIDQCVEAIKAGFQDEGYVVRYKESELAPSEDVLNFLRELGYSITKSH